MHSLTNLFYISREHFLSVFPIQCIVKINMFVLFIIIHSQTDVSVKNRFMFISLSKFHFDKVKLNSS